MKTVSSPLSAHLAGPTTSLATLWRVTRTDGVEFFFTDHDEDLVFEGNTYLSSVGYTSSAVDNQVGLSVDNLETTGFLDTASLAEADLRAGLFDFAEVRISVVNWKDLSQGDLKLRRGKLGEVVYSEVTGTFKAELRGMTQLYSQRPVELYQAECRADLGDGRCKVVLYPDVVLPDTTYAAGDVVRASPALDGLPVSPGVVAGLKTADFEDVVYDVTTGGTTGSTYPNFDPTPSAATAWGTAVFTAREAFVRAATVASVTDNRVFSVSFPNGADSREADDWFTYGAVRWDTGLNSGLVMEVKAFVAATDEVTLFLAMPFEVQVGDTLSIYAGCDKRLSTCINKFNNVLNFRGEPYVPGQDELLNYPDAR